MADVGSIKAKKEFPILKVEWKLWPLAGRSTG
jgi:hypothetical protein